MNSAEKKQALFQVLSLDVVLGSLAVGIFAVTILNVHPNPWWWFIMSAAVWVVYTLDHLLDGLKKKNASTIYRHWFHFRNRFLLGILVICMGIGVLVLGIIFLDQNIVRNGIILFMFSVFYFAMVFLFDKYSFNYFLKEFIIALVYISGIFLAPLVWFKGIPDLPVLFVIIFLFLLAWIESIIISFYDYDRDLTDGFSSFTTAFGLTNTRKFLISTLVIISVLLVISLTIISNHILSASILIELMMSVILLVLILFPDNFKANNRFRWIGEAVFYLPGLIYIVAIF